MQEFLKFLYLFAKRDIESYYPGWFLLRRFPLTLIDIMSYRSTYIRLVACTLGLVVAWVGNAVRADLITLNVNSAQSSITLAGNAFGLNYGPQAPGSLTAAWSGTITADRNGGVLTFASGSSITALVNSTGPYTTAPNPIGTEPGNYGVTTTGPVAGFGTVTINGVYKNLVLDITAGTAQNGAALNGATLSFTAGALDFGIANPAPLSVGTSNLVGVSGPNTSLTNVSWDGTTLTLPIAFSTTGSNRVENWSGVLVATIVAVPEPSSVALTSLGLAALVVCARRFRRKG